MQKKLTEATVEAAKKKRSKLYRQHTGNFTEEDLKEVKSVQGTIGNADVKSIQEATIDKEEDNIQHGITGTELNNTD